MNGKKAKAIRKAVYGSGGASRNPGKYVHFKDDEGVRQKYQELKKAVKLQGRMVGGAGQDRGGKNKKVRFSSLVAGLVLVAGKKGWGSSSFSGRLRIGSRLLGGGRRKRWGRRWGLVRGGQREELSRDRWMDNRLKDG